MQFVCGHIGCAVRAVVLCCIFALTYSDEASVTADGEAFSQNRLPSYAVPWPPQEPSIEHAPVKLGPCSADTEFDSWSAEALTLHHKTYGSASSGKRLLGVAMSVAPRPSGEHFEAVLASLPPSLPVFFHSRLNYSVLQHPQVCAEVHATPLYPQLQVPGKLNRYVQYRLTKAMDSTERTRWRSNIVLDVARTLEEASKLFHYVLYVEDDVALRSTLFDKLPELVAGRARMDVAQLWAEDLKAGNLEFLTHYHRDPQDHKYGNGDPWSWIWLSGQGMLAVLFDSRYLRETVDEMRNRFDEKPVDWLVRQIKYDKGWNTPSLGKRGYVNHLGSRSTFTADKRKRAVGSI